MTVNLDNLTHEQLKSEHQKMEKQLTQWKERALSFEESYTRELAEKILMAIISDHVQLGCYAKMAIEKEGQTAKAVMLKWELIAKDAISQAVTFKSMILKFSGHEILEEDLTQS